MVVPTASLRNPPTKTRTLPGVIKAVRFVSELPLSYPVRAGSAVGRSPSAILPADPEHDRF
jgi:hypothetical protein